MCVKSKIERGTLKIFRISIAHFLSKLCMLAKKQFTVLLVSSLRCHTKSSACTKGLQVTYVINSGYSPPPAPHTHTHFLFCPSKHLLGPSEWNLFWMRKIHLKFCLSKRFVEGSRMWSMFDSYYHSICYQRATQGCKHWLSGKISWPK